jgi:hypothetical protein
MTSDPTQTPADKARNVLFVLAGLAVLLLKRHYSGPGKEAVYGYGGNLGVSFALYFLLLQLPIPVAFRKPASAGLALAAVETFEVFNGFGVMANTYDPLDLIANALGVAVALAVDSKPPWWRKAQSGNSLGGKS